MPTPITNVLELVAFAAEHPQGCVQYWVNSSCTQPVLEHYQCAMNYFAKQCKGGELLVERIEAYTDVSEAERHSLRDVHERCTECGLPIYLRSMN